MKARADADAKLDANEFFQDLTPDPEFAKWQREQTASLSEKALIGALLQEHDRVFPIVQGAGITAATKLLPTGAAVRDGPGGTWMPAYA